jgi:hypothetical protein
MKTKSLLWLLATVLLTTAPFADAQQTGKIFRIGLLDRGTDGSAVHVDAFRKELSKLGWIEGKNITIEYRFAEGKTDRLPELAAELVRLKVITDGVWIGHHHGRFREGIRCAKQGATGRTLHDLGWANEF